MNGIQETTRLRQIRLGTSACIGLAPVCMFARQPVAALMFFVLGTYLYSVSRRSTRIEPEPETALEQAAKAGLSGLAICLILVAGFLFAIPQFPGGVRPFSNDAAAIATCKNLALAQKEFRGRAVLDHDGDGLPAYGSFLDLTRSQPPFLSQAFAELQRMSDGTSAIRRSGFWFQMHVIEPEAAWCCYAWPVMKNNSGKRAYFVDQSGVVRWSRNRRQNYNGTTKTPHWNAIWVDNGNWQAIR